MPGMSEHDSEHGGRIETRWSTMADDRGLADAHRAAWRYAYAGIIPGITLERMIARRGTGWWARMHDRGFRALVIDCDGTLAGYATLGRSRSPACPGGEIYELYLRPECQGCGLGRRLFTRARRELASHGLQRLTVWALADNALACRFYAAMGGAEAARTQDRFCGVPLDKIGFAWA
jgi:GNAT superfamily N-acetyltransferase